MIEDVFRDFDRVAYDAAPSYGRTDVYEKDQSLVFETEIPGANREDVSIRVENETLVVTGEVKRNEEIDRDNYFRIGRRYGKFQRSFPLPADRVDSNAIRATFENGILTITAPMKESIVEKEKPIEIPIQ